LAHQDAFPAVSYTRCDRLDNLLSLYFLHLDPGTAYALTLKTAHWYGQYEKLMDHWKALYPNDIFDVDYDRLAARIRCRRVAALLGLQLRRPLISIENHDGEDCKCLQVRHHSMPGRPGTPRAERSPAPGQLPR
jgi:hypothetical protein